MGSAADCGGSRRENGTDVSPAPQHLNTLWHKALKPVTPRPIVLGGVTGDVSPVTHPASFRLITLGRLALLDAAGTEDKSLGTRRRKLALLVVLAVSKRPVTRAALTELFWGDQPEERARHSLSDTLSHLRRALGADAIAARREDVALTEAVRLHTDIVELHAAAAAKRWTDVAALYGGAFLDGVHVPDSPRFDHWATTQRAHAERLFESACRTECARLSKADAWTDCAALANRWVEANPHSAEGALHLLSATVRAEGGGARRALQAYEQLERRLAREFSATPDPAVRAAAAELAPRASAEPWPVPVVDARPALTEAPAAATASAPADATAPSAPTPLIKPRARRTRALLWVGGIGAAATLALTVLGGTLAARDSEMPATPLRRETPLTSSDPRAIALYHEASDARRDGRGRDIALALLDSAIHLDTNFAMAYRAVASIRAGYEHDRSAVREALQRAADLMDGVTDYERSLILASYHIHVTSDLSRAAAALRAALQRDPTDDAVWHSLGQVYQRLGDDRRAADAYREGNLRDSQSVARWGNLIDVLYSAGDFEGARASLDSMARALPGSPIVYRQGAILSLAERDFSSAEQQLRAYANATQTRASSQVIAQSGYSRLYWTMGRFGDGDAAAQRAAELRLSTGDSAGALLEWIELAEAQVWTRRDPGLGARTLDAALERVPLESLRPLDRPLLELAKAYAVTGDLPNARAKLREYEKFTLPEVRRAEQAAVAHARGTIALIEGRFADAERDLGDVATPNCSVCGLPELALAYAARGRRTDEVSVLREYLDTPTLRRTDLVDALHRAWVEERVRGTAPVWIPRTR